MLAATTLTTFSALAPSAKTACIIGFASYFASQHPQVGLNIGDTNVVNPEIIPLNPDIIAFSQSNLKNVMVSENISGAVILQEQEALKVGLAGGKGTLVWNPDTSVWNYEASQTDFITPESFSSEEHSLYNFLIKGGLNKITELKNLYRNMNPYEQMHALFLAFGSLIFVRQCIEAVTSIKNCVTSFVGNSCSIAISFLSYLKNEKPNKIKLNNINKLNRDIQKIKSHYLPGRDFIINQKNIKWAYKGFNQKEKYNALTLQEKKALNSKQQTLFRSSVPINTNNPSGGGRTKRRSYKSKRRSYKSKRRRISKSKRRRHKTKKRAYRSTRFASHK
jgi:hypothetical protein